MSASTTRSAPEQIPQSLRQPVMADGSAPAGQDGKKHKGSIRRRLIVLCAFQILLVLASTMFLTRQIAEVAEYQARNVQLVSKAKLANSAQRTFGELKYWLSDLAVSLLVESESRAKDAQADLKVQLDELSRHDAETVLAMRTSLDVMIRQAYLAVDAYTNNTRVLGNSHMSTARIHIAKIDALLEAIVSRAEFDAYALENTVETKISEARVVGFAILIGGVLIGLAVAFYFLLSITRPLRELAVATIEVSNDYRNAEIPENFPAEIAVMADSLRRFRDNLIERDRLLEERAQSESQAEKARRLFRAFLDNAQTAFLLRRPEGEYILANKQWHEWFNQSGEEMEGLDVRGQSGSIEKESLDRHDEEVIGGRTSITREIDATLKDGSAKRFFMQKFPVTDENDAVVAIGMTFADITELRETERELVEQSYRAQEALEANAAMTEFLTNMSHELRTPLNAIIGFADVLSKGGENDISQDYRDFAGDILLSGQHLLDMINDLLDSAKIEKGEFEIEPERISLRGQLEDSIGLIEPQAAARSLLIETKLDGISEDTVLMADRRCFRQIILNLMSNAEKFSDSGSPIIVSATIEDSGLVFSVQDFGIGISAEYLEQVFDRFAQVEGGLQRKRGGTGIGLSISRALAELHGGTLTLESEEGKGTTAILRLPESVTTAPAEKSPEIEAKPATGTGPGRPLRILVAEDHKINQAVIRSILGELGHQVEIVGTGKEALAAVLRSPFDPCQFLFRIALGRVWFGRQGHERKAAHKIRRYHHPRRAAEPVGAGDGAGNDAAHRAPAGPGRVRRDRTVHWRRLQEDGDGAKGKSVGNGPPCGGKDARYAVAGDRQPHQCIRFRPAADVSAVPALHRRYRRFPGAHFRSVERL